MTPPPRPKKKKREKSVGLEKTGLQARRGGFHSGSTVKNLVPSIPYSQQAQTGHLRGELLGGGRLLHS